MNRIYFQLIRVSGLAWFLREVLKRNRVTILCYHSPSLAVADKHFQALSSAYNVIPLRQYIAHLIGNGDRSLPKKALIITLDDGFKENYQLLDTFKKHNIPATIFACSGIVGTNRHFWWKHLPKHISGMELEELPDIMRLNKLNQLGFNETQEFDMRQALSKREIEALIDVVDIQSHTRFHPALPQCDDNKAFIEIAKSKSELESAYDIEVYAISFPNGRYSEREIEFVKQSNYKSALTTEEGDNGLQSDPYRLKRIDIPDNASVAEVLAKASGAWRLLKIFVQKISRFKHSMNISKLKTES